MNEVLDLLGKPINVGDKVVYGVGGHYWLEIGKVIKITAKVVHIEDGETWSGKILRPFDDVLVLEKANGN